MKRGGKTAHRDSQQQQFFCNRWRRGEEREMRGELSLGRVEGYEIKLGQKNGVGFKAKVLCKWGRD